MIALTRKYEFSASHRLYNPEFSEEKNQAVFRECNNVNGHGHNYELEVTVTGVPDEQTGMLADIWELDRVVREHLIVRVDHKHLNLDVPFFESVIPTAENIVLKFWDQLAPVIPEPAALYRLRLMESRNNYAEYYGPQRIANPKNKQREISSHVR